MPYRWDDDAPGLRRLTIWPHRSLPRSGFAWVIGLAAAGLALPILSMLGRTALWGLLPFAGVAVAGLWIAIRLSDRQGTTRETLDLTPAALTVTRSDPGRPDRVWTANPHWVRLALHPRPVEDYLTLTDGQRVIELGAFLSPDERRALHAELTRALAGARTG